MGDNVLLQESAHLASGPRLVVDLRIVGEIPRGQLLDVRRFPVLSSPSRGVYILADLVEAVLRHLAGLVGGNPAVLPQRQATLPARRAVADDVAL